MEENKNRKTRKGVGRKPKTDPAVYRYVVRLNSEENVKFDIQFQKSGLRERSKFIKAMIFGKEIKVVRIDKATMDYYVRLTNFYHQFQAIGNNYNQTVKAIKNNFGEKRAYALLRNLEKTTIDLVVLSKRIIMLTHEFEENLPYQKAEGGGMTWWRKSTGAPRSMGLSSTTSRKWTTPRHASFRATA